MDKEQIERFKSQLQKEKTEKFQRGVSSCSHPEKEKIEQLESLMEEEDIEKFKRYEIEARQHLMSKYFSDKTIFGGNIFGVKTTKDGETTKMSSFPGYQSYADPANFNDGSSSKPNSTPSHVRKGKKPSKKN